MQSGDTELQQDCNFFGKKNDWQKRKDEKNSVIRGGMRLQMAVPMVVAQLPLFRRGLEKVAMAGGLEKQKNPIEADGCEGHKSKNHWRGRPDSACPTEGRQNQGKEGQT